jgi:hypothetical protein
VTVSLVLCSTLEEEEEEEAEHYKDNIDKKEIFEQARILGLYLPQVRLVGVGRAYLPKKDLCTGL